MIALSEGCQRAELGNISQSPLVHAGLEQYGLSLRQRSGGGNASADGLASGAASVRSRWPLCDALLGFFQFYASDASDASAVDTAADTAAVAGPSTAQRQIPRRVAPGAAAGGRRARGQEQGPARSRRATTGQKDGTQTRGFHLASRVVCVSTVRYVSKRQAGFGDSTMPLRLSVADPVDGERDLCRSVDERGQAHFMAELSRARDVLSEAEAWCSSGGPTRGSPFRDVACLRYEG